MPKKQTEKSAPDVTGAVVSVIDALLATDVLNAPAREQLEAARADLAGDTDTDTDTDTDDTD